MSFQIMEGKIAWEDAAGKLLAEALLPTAYGCIALLHRVYVDETLRGQGIASRLMDEVVRYLKERGLMVCPTCPYARAWFDRHPEYAGLVTSLPIL